MKVYIIRNWTINIARIWLTQFVVTHLSYKIFDIPTGTINKSILSQYIIIIYTWSLVVDYGMYYYIIHYAFLSYFNV